MNFSHPAFLWTLVAIGVPLAIHLLSRKEGKVVKVGSLRHMEASTTSRFKSLRLNELLLLAARCLMITWLALFLSGAACTSTGVGTKAGWVLTEGGMDRNPLVRPLIDSLTDAGFEWRTLAEGFPSFNPGDSTPPTEYWKLTDMLEMEDREIVVISYNVISGFNQMRRTMPVNVRWITVDPPSREFLLSATRINSDSLVVRSGQSNNDATSYSTQSVVAMGEWYQRNGIDSVQIRSRDTISVAFVDDDEYAADLRVLKAAILSIAQVGVIVVETSAESADWTFWLRNGEPERPLSSNTILFRSQHADSWIVRRDVKEWHLTRRLTPDDALSQHLTVDLAQTLLAEQAAENRNDVRAMPEAMMWSSATPLASENKSVARPNDLGVWLVVLFAVTWATERALALSRNL